MINKDLNEKNNLNDLSSKVDYETLFEKMSDPILRYFTEGSARINFPNYNAAHYNDSTIQFESFSRILYGVGPFSKDKNNSPIITKVKEGLINGTNPKHSEYWGEVSTIEQKIVEMPPLALFLFFSKDFFWDNLSVLEKKNIENWLLQVNQKKYANGNWLFFRLLVNVVLKKLEANYDERSIENSLERIEKCYLANGWYSDGKGDTRDYYNSFAFHYYSLIYAKINEDEDPKNSKIFKERATLFAEDYINWFSEDGSSIPYGRSLTYKFAQIAFWSAIVFADVQVFSLGVIKGIINRHMRWWLDKDIFDYNGILSIGYVYPNIIMTEDYNGSGSSYWSFKVFLILALEKNHNYWNVLEECLPELNKKKYQPQAKMVICRDESGKNIVSFVNGQNSYTRGNSYEAKYEKYAYSSLFGFSVSKSMSSLNDGAFDSTLAASLDGKVFIPRSRISSYTNSENILYSIWRPWDDVEIECFLLPEVPWHVRVYKVKTKRKLFLQDGGFSIEKKSHNNQFEERSILKEKNAMALSYDNLHTGIASLLQSGNLKITSPSPNTNILHPRTELPVARWIINKGEYILISAVLGDINSNRNNQNFFADLPTVKIEGKKLIVNINSKNTEIDLGSKIKSPSKNIYERIEYLKDIKRFLN